MTKREEAVWLLRSMIPDEIAHVGPQAYMAMTRQLVDLIIDAAKEEMMNTRLSPSETGDVEGECEE